MAKQVLFQLIVVCIVKRSFDFSETAKGQQVLWTNGKHSSETAKGHLIPRKRLKVTSFLGNS